MSENYSTVVDYLDTKINERIRETEEFLGSGNVNDFNEYHKLCGVIQGLGHAKQLIADLARRMENEDE